MRIEKRIPFGFKGEWGKVYKNYVFDETKENIEYQRNNYVDIGEDVQFKYLENGIDKSINLTQPIMNLPTNAEYRVAKTTDAYLNIDTNNYECVVGLNDIVYAFGCFWLVEKIEEKSIFNPIKQTFYYIGLKRIFSGIIRKG